MTSRDASGRKNHEISDLQKKKQTTTERSGSQLPALLTSYRGTVFERAVSGKAKEGCQKGKRKETYSFSTAKLPRRQRDGRAGEGIID